MNGRSNFEQDVASAIDEERIRMLVEERMQAIHAGDLARMLDHHAPDVVMFDVLEPLQYVGSSTVLARAGKWLGSNTSPVGYEIRDLVVTAGNSVAFCHYLCRVTGGARGSQPVDVWVRTTSCLRKVEGAWSIVHEHHSVPLVVANAQAWPLATRGTPARQLDGQPG